MSRRRRAPGVRARVIGQNLVIEGMVVVILRPYEGEVLGRFSWNTETVHAWVVLSLSGPMQWVAGKGANIEGADFLAAIDDKYLEPLDDSDDGLSRSTEKDKPLKKPRAKAVATGGAA